MAGLFQVLWGQPKGTFKKAETLNGTDNEPLIIPVDDPDPNSSAWIENICTRPTAVDWDGDKDLDLVVGNFPGGFYLFTGEGNGRFAPKPVSLVADGKPLKVDGAHSDPFPIDWDKDGDVDLLSGSNSGGVYLAENTAGPGKTPELKPFQVLIEPARNPAGYAGTLKESELTAPLQATRVWADDINSDGKLDLLVGDRATLISPAKGLSEDEFKKELETWQKSFDAAMEKLRTAGNDAEKQTEASRELNSVYAKRSKFIVEDYTGFVWLYLQK